METTKKALEPAIDEIMLYFREFEEINFRKKLSSYKSAQSNKQSGKLLEKPGNHEIGTSQRSGYLGVAISIVSYCQTIQVQRRHEKQGIVHFLRISAACFPHVFYKSKKADLQKTMKKKTT